MPVSPARIAAFEILLAVEQRDAYASDMLHSPRYEELSAADHGLATELAMGVLRWRSLLDDRILPYSSVKLERLDAEVLTALRLAAYQLIFLDRVPGRAAVHQSVELVKRARKRSAAPFVNAVLRKLGGSLPVPVIEANSAEELARSSAHPRWLVERWIREYGLATCTRICTYDQQVPPTSIHVPQEAEGAVQKAGVSLGPGYLLASARTVIGNEALDHIYEAGASIQDEGSQLVALLLGEGKHFLDCCAAPGGKTRLLAQRNPAATVFAAELHPHRAKLLRKLVSAANVHVVTADACNLPTPALFDRILVDVPCSGTGTLARNPEIKWKLGADDLCDLQQRQTAILQAAIERLAPGGRLVYSTCSLEREENQQVVERIVSQQSSIRLVDCGERLRELQSTGELVWQDLKSLTSGPYLRTIPGVHRCDGFFATIFEKI